MGKGENWYQGEIVATRKDGTVVVNFGPCADVMVPPGGMEGCILPAMNVTFLLGLNGFMRGDVIRANLTVRQEAWEIKAPRVTYDEAKTKAALDVPACSFVVDGDYVRARLADMGREATDEQVLEIMDAVEGGEWFQTMDDAVADAVSGACEEILGEGEDNDDGEWQWPSAGEGK